MFEELTMRSMLTFKVFLHFASFPISNFYVIIVILLVIDNKSTEKFEWHYLNSFILQYSVGQIEISNGGRKERTLNKGPQITTVMWQ